jgi:hypothetical protein
MAKRCEICGKGQSRPQCECSALRAESPEGPGNGQRGRQTDSRLHPLPAVTEGGQGGLGRVAGCLPWPAV